MESVDQGGMKRAILSGDVATVRRLAPTWPHLDVPDHTTPMTPLLMALDNGRHEIIEILIAAGSDVNASVAHGWTPLHEAVDSESQSALQSGIPASLRPLRSLLAAGADPGARATMHGGGLKTPRDIALDYGWAEAADLLAS